jgi:fermentation-respiration switch protein FrsA (DUF1100 family)
MNLWSRVGLVSIMAAPLLVLVIGSYMVQTLTRAKRVEIADRPCDHGLDYEDVSFRAFGDGLLLRGWYLKAKRGDRCIIMTHGGNGHRADETIGMIEIAGGLVRRGYNVLMFDLRGHGESEGHRMSGGYHEKKDLQGAVEYVKRRGIPAGHIGLLGFSLGAAASLLLAAEDDSLPAVVADSSWADLADLVQSQIARRSRAPGFFGPLVPLVSRAVYGIDITKVRPLDAVQRIAPRPIFFIHGESDEVVPVKNSIQLYHQTDCAVNKLWVVPEAEHVRSYRTAPQEYIDNVVAFFDEFTG